ncbi:helix-turn-helix transcriptional regulator [Dactylosporangium salmoneum]|uniref:HTH luxR-type domain-containing protein n=1 Tax=Dactylosporangium salmoneum TaxID=53361 RepID=A0ABP5T7C3_9ACTN
MTAPQTVAEAQYAIDQQLHVIDLSLREVGKQLRVIDEHLGTVNRLRAELSRLRRRRPTRTSLSRAEMDVARRFAWSGLSVPQIARERHVSPNTVKSQLRAAYQLLGVRERAELKQALQAAGHVPAGEAA